MRKSQNQADLQLTKQKGGGGGEEGREGRRETEHTNYRKNTGQPKNMFLKEKKNLQENKGVMVKRVNPMNLGGSKIWENIHPAKKTGSPQGKREKGGQGEEHGRSK